MKVIAFILFVLALLSSGVLSYYFAKKFRIGWLGFSEFLAIGVIGLVAWPSFTVCTFGKRKSPNEAKWLMGSYRTTVKAFFSETATLEFDARKIGFNPEGRIYYLVGPNPNCHPHPADVSFEYFVGNPPVATLEGDFNQYLYEMRRIPCDEPKLLQFVAVGNIDDDEDLDIWLGKFAMPSSGNSENSFSSFTRLASDDDLDSPEFEKRTLASIDAAQARTPWMLAITLGFYLGILANLLTRNQSREKI